MQSYTLKIAERKILLLLFLLLLYSLISVSFFVAKFYPSFIAVLFFFFLVDTRKVVH